MFGNLQVMMNIWLCKYTAVTKAAQKMAFLETVEDEEDWDIFWTDLGFNLGVFKRMKNY